jgi:hypothetical protein
MKAECFSARAITPGTKVFWGEPLMKGAFSRIHAVAKIVEGAISAWPEAMDWRRLSAVSLTPGTMLAKRSVLAVHWTMILSRLCFDLNSLVGGLAWVIGSSQ